MAEIPELKLVARIQTDFPSKFGVPRQSGLVESLRARVVFEPEYRVCEALRGLDGFSHIWLIWSFSQSIRPDWSPTVRPPRLGGNTRLGVFSTRSPFRPNPLGLSCVRLEEIDLHTSKGPVLWVSGADLVDGTPILDIKPYLPYVDCKPDAVGGFAGAPPELLQVEFPPRLLALVPPQRQEALLGVLACDPRPAYQRDPQRVYGLSFGGVNVRFTVADGVLTVESAAPAPEEPSLQ